MSAVRKSMNLGLNASTASWPVVQATELMMDRAARDLGISRAAWLHLVKRAYALEKGVAIDSISDAQHALIIARVLARWPQNDNSHSDNLDRRLQAMQQTVAFAYQHSTTAYRVAIEQVCARKTGNETQSQSVNVAPQEGRQGFASPQIAAADLWAEKLKTIRAANESALKDQKNEKDKNSSSKVPLAMMVAAILGGATYLLGDSGPSGVAPKFVDLPAHEIPAQPLQSIWIADFLPTDLAERDGTKLYPGILTGSLGIESAVSIVDSQFRLGQQLLEGASDSSDVVSGLYWLKIAAEENYALAEYKLGEIHRDGIVLPRDLRRAAFYLSRAALHGHRAAMVAMADLAAELPGDLAQRVATAWYREAALYGDARSQAILAERFADGIGGDKKSTEAYFWFSILALKGDQLAASRRSQLFDLIDQQTLRVLDDAASSFASRSLDPRANDGFQSWNQAANIVTARVRIQ